MPAALATFGGPQPPPVRRARSPHRCPDTVIIGFISARSPSLSAREPARRSTATSSIAFETLADGKWAVRRSPRGRRLPVEHRERHCPLPRLGKAPRAPDPIRGHQRRRPRRHRTSAGRERTRAGFVHGRGARQQHHRDEAGDESGQDAAIFFHGSAASRADRPRDLFEVLTHGRRDRRRTREGGQAAGPAARRARRPRPRADPQPRACGRPACRRQRAGRLRPRAGHAWTRSQGGRRMQTRSCSRPAPGPAAAPSASGAWTATAPSSCWPRRARADVERYVMISSIGAENPPRRRRRLQHLPASQGGGRPRADRRAIAPGPSSGPATSPTSPGTGRVQHRRRPGARQRSAVTTSRPSSTRSLHEPRSVHDHLRDRGRGSGGGGLDAGTAAET